MEIDRFDALTRALSTTDSRRRMLRALGGTLLGGMLGSVATMLGLGEGADANAKKHGKRHKGSKQSGHVQAERKNNKKRRKKHKKRKPVTDGFACSTAVHCQVVQENTADGTVDFGACPGDGNARALCESATHTADFRTLMNHLRATGFTLIADPRPTLEVYEVRQDGTPGENVLVLRFAKEAAGQTALLRYGRDADGQHAAAYAFVQEDATPTFLLAVDNGAVTKTPLNEHASHRARPSSRVNAEANPDNPNPYEGQANELCSECPVVCKTLGSIECGLIILVLSRGNKVAAATLGPLCSKPAEKACGPYCDSMIAPALEDDPQNCGACGHACSGQQVCCGGSCVGGTCPPGQHFDRATCKCACGPGLETCADHTCCDGQCTQYTCCPASQDFCLGTCCIPGNRCVKNGRHGICCSPERTHDCYYASGEFLGCYDPAKCYCDTLAGKLVCNP